MQDMFYAFNALIISCSGLITVDVVLRAFSALCYHSHGERQRERERGREQPNIEKEISIESSMFVLIGIWIDKQRCIRFFIIF